MSSLVCFFCFLLEHDCIVTIIFNCIVLVESLCHTSFNLSKDLDFNIVAFYHLSYHGTKCGAGDLYIFLLQVTFKQLLLDTPFFNNFFLYCIAEIHYLSSRSALLWSPKDCTSCQEASIRDTQGGSSNVYLRWKGAMYPTV